MQFFYLFEVEVGFNAVFTAGFFWMFLSLAILVFSGVARFAPSLLALSIGLIGPSSPRSYQLGSESLTVLSAILKNVSRDTADLMDRREHQVSRKSRSK